MNIKYQCTKIAKNREMPKPSQKDWQKSQCVSLSKNSLGELICAHSKIPHFIARVRMNFTRRLTAKIYATNSIILHVK